MHIAVDARLVVNPAVNCINHHEKWTDAAQNHSEHNDGQKNVKYGETDACAPFATVTIIVSAALATVTLVFQTSANNEALKEYHDEH